MTSEWRCIEQCAIIYRHEGQRTTDEHGHWNKDSTFSTFRRWHHFSWSVYQEGECSRGQALLPSNEMFWLETPMFLSGGFRNRTPKMLAHSLCSWAMQLEASACRAAIRCHSLPLAQAVCLVKKTGLLILSRENWPLAAEHRRVFSQTQTL